MDRIGCDSVKKKKPEQELKELCAEIIREREDWKDINEQGCNDPFWPDGCNMNLVRNHILYYRKKIEDICEEIKCVFPEEYYLPVPPEVPENYMASLKQKERVNRLRSFGDEITTKKTKFVDDGQLTFGWE